MRLIGEERRKFRVVKRREKEREGRMDKTQEARDSPKIRRWRVRGRDGKIPRTWHLRAESQSPFCELAVKVPPLTDKWDKHLTFNVF